MSLSPARPAARRPLSVAADLQLQVLERVIPAATVEPLLERFGVTSKRERKLPAKFMVYFIIALCLFKHKAMRETLRTVLEECPTIGGHPRPEAIATSGAITKARNRLGVSVMESLYTEFVTPLATRDTPGAFFKQRRVVIMDGSTLAFTDTAANFAAFGGAGKGKERAGSFPMANIVVLVEAGTHVIFDATLERYTTGETTLAKALLPRLDPTMLCVLDRAYIGYPWLQAAKTTGADFVIRVRGNMKLPVCKELEDGSYLSYLSPPKGVHWHGARAIRVRVIEYQLPGSMETYRVITTLLRPKDASARELAALYHERWEVESTLREVKDYLRIGGLALFRSQTPALVRQEFYGYLLAHFILRTVILDAAHQAGADPDVLRFTHTWHVLMRKLPHMVGGLSQRQVNQWYARLIEEVLEERVSSSRGESIERGVRRYSKYKIRGQGPTTPRQKDFTVHPRPAVV